METSGWWKTLRRGLVRLCTYLALDIYFTILLRHEIQMSNGGSYNTIFDGLASMLNAASP